MREVGSNLDARGNYLIDFRRRVVARVIRRVPRAPKVFDDKTCYTGRVEARAIASQCLSVSGPSSSCSVRPSLGLALRMFAAAPTVPRVCNVIRLLAGNLRVSCLPLHLPAFSSADPPLPQYLPPPSPLICWRPALTSLAPGFFDWHARIVGQRLRGLREGFRAMDILLALCRGAFCVFAGPSLAAVGFAYCWASVIYLCISLAPAIPERGL